MAVAFSLVATTITVVGIALAQSAFPLLSNAVAKKEWARFNMYLKKGIFTVLGLTIPGAIVLVLATPIAAQLVHLQRVLPVFGMALALYAISIPFESLNHLLLRSYYALHKTATPAIMNVVNGTVAIALAWILVPKYGVYALGLSFTAGQVVQAAGLAIMLPGKMKKASA